MICDYDWMLCLCDTAQAMITGSNPSLPVQGGRHRIEPQALVKRKPAEDSFQLSFCVFYL